MDGFSRAFASTTFEDQDAGSGPVTITASPSLAPVTTAIHNISARHLHDIGAAVPDERQALRGWRRQLQDCMNQQHARMVRFLVSGGGDPSGSDLDIARRCQEVLAKYSKPTWNFASSIRDIAISADISGAADDLSSELGMSVETLRTAQKRAVRAYVQAATAVCAAETRLEEKLKRLDTIASRVNELMFLEPTEELGGLTAPVRAYLDSVYERVGIEEDYTALVENYKRFATLRGLVGLSQFERPPAPTCTICMTREVTTALTPCGHTFCEDCVRNQMTSCYICRVQIRDKLRLYFS
jgi:hypothetical protein